MNHQKLQLHLIRQQNTHSLPKLQQGFSTRSSKFLNAILDKDKNKIEVKTERDWWFKTGNIAIEVECNGKPSGIMATKADYWVHILAEGDKDYCRLIFDTRTVKR